MKILDKSLEYESKLKEFNPGMNQQTVSLFVQAFLTGAKTQREMDIEICSEIQLRSLLDKVPQPGAMSAQIKIEETGY